MNVEFNLEEGIIGFALGLAVTLAVWFLFYQANITEEIGDDQILIDCNEVADIFNNNQTEVSAEKAGLCYEEFPELFYAGIIDGLQNDVVNIISILNQARGEV